MKGQLYLLAFAALVLAGKVPRATADGDAPQAPGVPQESLENRLLQKINQVESNMEAASDTLKSDLESRLAETEAKLANLEKLFRNCNCFGAGGGTTTGGGTQTPSKTKASRITELTTLLGDIQSQIDKLSEPQRGSVTRDQFSVHKYSVQSQLQTLERRLEGVTRELRQESSGDAALLKAQLASMQVTVRRLELEARLKKRKENVDLIKMDFPGNMTSTRKLISDLEEDLEEAMPEIMSVIYGGRLEERFEPVLTLLQYLTATQRKAGIIRLSESMQEHGQQDSEQFLQLARFAKASFGNMLKRDFPLAYAALIWSQEVCLQVKGKGSSSSSSGSGHSDSLMALTPNQTQFQRGRSYNLELKTRIDPQDTRDQSYCHWQLHTVLDQQIFISYNYRKGHIRKYWDLVLSSGQVQVRNQDQRFIDDPLNPSVDIYWTASSRNNGSSLVIKSFGQVPATYLCHSSTPQGDHPSVFSVLMSSTLTSSCHWLVGNN